MVGDRQTAGSSASYTVSFTTSAAGALAAGGTITTTFNAAFTVSSSATVVLGSGFSNCVVSTVSVTATQVVTTLGDNGASTCALAKNSTGVFTIDGITNPAAATYSTGNTVKTSKDTTASSSASIVISAATQTTAPAFTGTTTAAGARATWTAALTTSASGFLSSGDTITITLPGSFAVPTLTTSSVTLAGTGFTGANCGVGSVSQSGGGAGNWSIVVTLADSGGTCTVANSAALQVKIAGLTNPSASTLTAANLTVKTLGDTSAKASAATVNIPAATKVTSLAATGAPQTGGARSTWTIGFPSSASVAPTTGALGAGDFVTVTFPAGFTVPTTPSVALTGGFSSCTAAGSGSGQVVTITLAGASCSLPAGTGATLTIATLTNPGAGSASITVATSTDVLAQTVSPSITAATPVTSVTFTG